MNEILVDVLSQDAYVDALTLGPEPGVMDGCDITISRDDVLMSFAVGDTGNVYWQDREYPMRPGTRHVDNICGARFRSKQAGAAALVNAALTGPAQPRLEPIIPLPATGTGDPFALQHLVNPFSPLNLGPFDVGDWPALLLALHLEAPTALQGATLTAQYIPDPNQQVPAVPIVLQRSLGVCGLAAGYTQGRAESGLLLVENLARLVSLILTTTGGPTVDVYAAPIAFPRQQLYVAPVAAAEDLLFMITPAGGVTVPANSSLKFLIPPYKGIGQLVMTTSAAGGPITLELDAVDPINPGTVLSRLYVKNSIAAGAVVSDEVPLRASPMSLSVTNTSATTAIAVTLALSVKERPF